MFNHLRHIILTATAITTASVTTASAQNILSMRDTITDPSFIYPESYEADTHRLMQDWYLNCYTSLDVPPSKTANKPVDDDEYVRRLQTMPTIIEMPFNSIVKGCIEMYVDRRRSQVERMLGMSTYYMPIFEQALENEGVPLELRYLPIIESALDPNAVSRAGATGLWQFMLSTARGLGLEISSLVDERRDPVRSSQMAARYLKQLYDIYNDWSLAIAAYNCGPGNVNKALKRAGEGKKDFWEIYPYLPAETRGYLPGFIAANYAMTYYADHGISPVLAKRPVITDSVHVNKRVHFQQISDVLDIPIDEIRLLNPQYRQDIIPGDIKPYPLVLPSHQVLSYLVSEDSIINHNAHLYARRGIVEPADGTTRISDDGNYIIREVIKYHKVRKGETFAAIAKRYGVTVASIKRVNGIKTLRRGRTIKIVTTERVPRPAEDIAAETVDICEETIPVTFDAAADSLGIDTSSLQVAPASELGEDDSNVTQPTENVTRQDGDETVDATAAETARSSGNEADRRIRETFAQREAAAVEQSRNDSKTNARTDKPQQSKPVYVKVKKGDTMSKIARNNGLTLKQLERLNPSVNPSKIKIGDRIRIK